MTEVGFLNDAEASPLNPGTKEVWHSAAALKGMEPSKPGVYFMLTAHPNSHLKRSTATRSEQPLYWTVGFQTFKHSGRLTTQLLQAPKGPFQYRGSTAEGLVPEEPRWPPGKQEITFLLSGQGCSHLARSKFRAQC